MFIYRNFAKRKITYNVKKVLIDVKSKTDKKYNIKNDENTVMTEYKLK